MQADEALRVVCRMARPHVSRGSLGDHARETEALAVVEGLAKAPPHDQRNETLVALEALARDWDVTLVAGRAFGRGEIVLSLRQPGGARPPIDYRGASLASVVARAFGGDPGDNVRSALGDMSPAVLLGHLERAEIDGARAPDARRVLSAERQSLALAMRSGDAAKISAARDEALRVARMWEGR